MASLHILLLASVSVLGVSSAGSDVISNLPGNELQIPSADTTKTSPALGYGQDGMGVTIEANTEQDDNDIRAVTTPPTAIPTTHASTQQRIALDEDKPTSRDPEQNSSDTMKTTLMENAFASSTTSNNSLMSSQQNNSLFRTVGLRDCNSSLDNRTEPRVIDQPNFGPKDVNKTAANLLCENSTADHVGRVKPEMEGPASNGEPVFPGDLDPNSDDLPGNGEVGILDDFNPISADGGSLPTRGGVGVPEDFDSNSGLLPGNGDGSPVGGLDPKSDGLAGNNVDGFPDGALPPALPGGQPPALPGGEPPPLLPPGASTMGSVAAVKLGLSAASVALSVLGVGLNVPSLLVYWRAAPSFTNTLMVALLALKTVCLVVGFPNCVADTVYENSFTYPLPFAYFRLASELTLLVALRRSVLLLTALMTMDRFRKNVYSLHMRGKNVVKRPRLVIALTIVLVLVFSIVETFFRWEVVEVYDPSENTTVGSILPSALFTDNMLVLYFFLLSNVLFQYIPGLVLVVANFCLLVFLVRYEIQFRREGIRNTSTSSTRSSATQSVGLILTYSTLILALNVPIEVYMTRDVFRQLGDWDDGTGSVVLRPTGSPLLPNIFACVNIVSWSSDFVIFFLVSASFRADFKKLF